MSFDDWGGWVGGGGGIFYHRAPHPPPPHPIPMDSIVSQSWPRFWNGSHSSCSLVGSVAAKGDGGPV